MTPTRLLDRSMDQQPDRFAVEYEDCADANRSQCCGGLNDDKDIGLDSTLNYSIVDDLRAPAIRNRALSTAGKLHNTKNEDKLNRTAFSQHLGEEVEFDQDSLMYNLNREHDGELELAR